MQAEPAANELELQGHVRHRAQMRRRRRALGMIVCVLLGIRAAPYAWVLYWCGSATWQEPDVIPYALALQRLSRTGEEIVPVATSGRVWMQANRREFAESDAMTRLLARQGWRLADVEGAGRYYKKDGKTLLLSERMFTGRYMTFKAIVKP